MRCSICGLKMKFLGKRSGIEYRECAVITQMKWICLEKHETEDMVQFAINDLNKNE